MLARCYVTLLSLSALSLFSSDYTHGTVMKKEAEKETEEKRDEKKGKPPTDK